MLDTTVKLALISFSKQDQKLVFKSDYLLMQGQSIEDCSKRAFCNNFDHIKLPFVFKTFVLYIFEWPLKTGFTVQCLLFNS